MKLSKTELSKIVQSGEFLGRLLEPFLKTGLPLMKNILKPLAKSVLNKSSIGSRCRNSEETTWLDNHNNDNFK